MLFEAPRPAHARNHWKPKNAILSDTEISMATETAGCPTNNCIN